MLNNVRKHDLLVQRAMKKRFIFFSSLLFYCLALIFIIELLIALECVAELFLYYGKCIFPVLYGIPYTPPITHEQMPQFHLALFGNEPQINNRCGYDKKMTEYIGIRNCTKKDQKERNN